MELFLKFLIYQMRTLDGSRNSAVPLLDLMNQNSFAEYKKIYGIDLTFSRKC